MRGSRLRGNDGGVHINDVCINRRGGVRGSCRWFGRLDEHWGSVTFGSEPPLLHTGGRGCEVPACAGTTEVHINDVCGQCINRQGYGVMGSCRWFDVWRLDEHWGQRDVRAVREPPLHPHRGPGVRGSRLRGNDGAVHINDVCGQCINRRGYGVRGSCRWFGVWRLDEHWGSVTLGRFANRPYIHTGGRGCEVPACAGTTEPSRGTTGLPHEVWTATTFLLASLMPLGYSPPCNDSIPADQESGTEYVGTSGHLMPPCRSVPVGSLQILPCT